MARPLKGTEPRNQRFVTRATQDTINKINNIKSWVRSISSDADVLETAVNDLHAKNIPATKKGKPAFVQPQLPIKKTKSKKA